jgi:hypothetical protein
VLKNGRELHSHVPVNKGAGSRALTAADIQEKFIANATLWLDAGRAQSVIEAVMNPATKSVRSVMQSLRAPAR